MKASPWTLLLLLAVFVGNARAQIKGARDYFPKDHPALSPRPVPAKPKAADRQPAPGQPTKFKDLTTNAVFYFASDTNRVAGWTKISARAAKNNKSGLSQNIGPETRVTR